MNFLHFANSKWRDLSRFFPKTGRCREGLWPTVTLSRALVVAHHHSVIVDPAQVMKAIQAIMARGPRGGRLGHEVHI